jgi:hypothetical protein
MTESLRTALGRQLTLNRAHAAAHAGDLELAGRLLDELDAAGASTEASLDLRARVHAQQGNLPEADAFWARVLLLAPDDKDAQAGRDTIARIRAGRRARPLINISRVAAVGATTVGVALVSGVAWVASSQGDSAPRAAASSNGRVTEVRRLEQQVASLASARKAAEGARRAAAERRAQELASIAAAFRMPGVRVERRAVDVRLVFRAGVFLPDTAEFAPGSRPLLNKVGRRLARVKASTTVVGHSVAIAGGRTGGGSTVALWRAQIAAQALAASGKLPLTAFTLATADQSNGPFADAARNRTVTLVFRPVG